MTTIVPLKSSMPIPTYRRDFIVHLRVTISVLWLLFTVVEEGSTLKSTSAAHTYSRLGSLMGYVQSNRTNVIPAKRVLKTECCSFATNGGQRTLQSCGSCDFSTTDLISLDDMNIEAIDPNVFQGASGLSSVRRLYMGRNPLSSLPDGVFRYLTNLERLLLDRNSLSSISKESFEGLGKVTEMYLNDNSLSSLPVDVFQHMPNLDRLLLDHNCLRSLPRNVFDGLTNLRAL
eukprot:gb/GECG01004072.1/.p1 GENE.gb/GECG01004072.1/~~gb/GECG01004072.1/.p1  ORF type:complete len:231 (+),score=9.47 gb/GECG01004072.1/:1-693(+)